MRVSKNRTVLCTKKHTQLSKWLVNIVEYLAAKELQDISLRSWKRPKTELKESKYCSCTLSGDQKHDSK